MSRLIIALIALNVILAACLSVRSVKAEDDCYEPTTIVTRLPVIGLVCILE